MKGRNSSLCLVGSSRPSSNEVYHLVHILSGLGTYLWSVDGSKSILFSILRSLIKDSELGNWWIDVTNYEDTDGSILNRPWSPLVHNGENDSHKRQFLALGVCSQSWKLDNLSKKKSCQIGWCYKLLATIWQKIFLLSNVDCKVSNLWNKIAEKRGQLALISKCQIVSGNII